MALGLDTWNLTPSANASFKNSTGITYTLLLNARQSLIDYYGGSGYYDRSVVIGADGVLKYKGTSYVNSDFEQVIEAIQTELDALVVSAESDPDQPETMLLEQNYPNPFNPATVISYQLAVNSDVELKVYDMLGREISVLVDRHQSAGTHRVEFDAAGLNSGIYIYQLKSSLGVLTRKMTLIK